MAGLRIPIPESKKLWGKTKVGPNPVEIFVVPASAIPDYDALSGITEGVFYVWLHPDNLNNRRVLVDTLLHEFTHLLETINDDEMFDPEWDADNCTPLARTIGKQMGELICNLKVVKGRRNPFLTPK